MAPVVAITAGVSLIGGVVGAMGAVKEGEAKQAAAYQNQAIATYNRDVALRNRGVVLAQSDADVVDKTKELTRHLSTIRAAYGANGLALEGSPLDVINDTAQEGALDISKTKYKGDIQAAGYTDEAANYGMKAQLAKNEGDAAPGIAALSATSQFLNGVTRAGSLWSKG